MLKPEMEELQELPQGPRDSLLTTRSAAMSSLAGPLCRSWHIWWKLWLYIIHVIQDDASPPRMGPYATNGNQWVGFDDKVCAYLNYLHHQQNYAIFRLLLRENVTLWRTMALAEEWFGPWIWMISGIFVEREPILWWTSWEKFLDKMFEEFMESNIVNI